MYEGEVTLFLAGGREDKRVERRLFLFNDLIICTRVAKRSAKEKGKLWDVEFLIGDLRTVVAEDVVSDQEPYKFCLRTPGQSYVISSNEKSAWMQLIQDSIARLGAQRLELSGLSELEKSGNAGLEGTSDISREQLVALIIEWSKSDNAEAVLMEVKELAASFQPDSEFEDGKNMIEDNGLL